ncbi:MAG: tRNA pseudouridine(55) synthase TruB [Deltaproteobacteria bacterium]
MEKRAWRKTVGQQPMVGGPQPRDTSWERTGVLLLNKPPGPSSFYMVRQIRRILEVKKVGHAGTLDPFASGLLIVCIGRPATRKISLLMATDKEYEATLRLGVETSTQDPEGEIIAEREVPPLDRETVEHCLAGFVGTILQVPPRFSALKHAGRPLYYYARRGVEVKKEPRPVTIHRLELCDLDGTRLRIRVRCGKGTYIRTLAADIGASIGCGAHLIGLRRTRSGPFSLQDAYDGSFLARAEAEELQGHVRPVDDIVRIIKEGS